MKFSLLFSIIFIPFIYLTQYWEEISDFSGTARDDGAVFVIQNKAYCGTGLEVGWNPTGDFRVLNLDNDNWSTGVSLPSGKERQYACTFSTNQLGFVFGGTKSTSFLNDLWMFDPLTNSWTEKTPLPSTGRGGSSCFVIGTKAYIVGGAIANNIYTDEVWEYDITTDTWTQKNACPFGTNFRASACSKNGLGYILFGRNENLEISDKLLKYSPTIDSWELLNNFPLGGRTYASFISFGEHLVTLFGMDSTNQLMNDSWSYDINLNQWFQLQDLPSSGRRGGMCFTSSDEIYYTTGLDTIGRTADTWKLNNLFLGLSTVFPVNPLFFYDEQQKTINIQTNQVLFSYEILDLMGNILSEGKTYQSNTQIDISNFTKGIYVMHLSSEHQTTTIKFFNY